ncbi:MAG: PorT family protein [Bacteroidetes bacterium]|nr:PorT family protein [Bacteroidota bacterium]
MKKVLTLILAAALTIPAMAQEPEAPEAPEAPVEAVATTEIEEIEEVEPIEEITGDTTSVIGRIEVIDAPDQTRVSLGKNEVIIVEENGDTVIVGLGSKGISIVEDGDGVQINVLDMEKKKSKHHKKHKKRFDAHWAGLEVGLNNYLTPDFSLVLPPGEEFMDLNTGKSWNWNLNVADFGVGLGTNYVGLVSGVGFELINYNFDGQNSIMKENGTGNIVEYVPPYAGSITKSKMNITYLTVPLLMEFQIPTGNHNRIHFSAGVIGGVKLWSNTKMKYTEAGDKSKEKNKSDFNLSPLRWGVTARVGYRGIGIFANYYMTSLFKPGMGPELYPFSIGIALAP